MIDAAVWTPPRPAADETLDRLTADWHIFQLRRGHRYSTDDLMVAWLASRVAPDARRLLDIGAGIGSVGLLTLWNMAADAHLTMVEVQEVSHCLARKTVAFNGLDGRVALRHGDLRDESSVPERAAFDLVTGSPPYIPLGKGVVSPVPQRAGARIELRGDVFDYCRTAARAMCPDGWFCLAHAAADPRPEAAIEAAGLRVRHRADVYFREGRAPTIAVFAAAFDGAREDLPPIVIRGRDGVFSDQYQAIRSRTGGEV